MNQTCQYRIIISLSHAQYLKEMVDLLEKNFNAKLYSTCRLGLEMRGTFTAGNKLPIKVLKELRRLMILTEHRVNTRGQDTRIIIDRIYNTNNIEKNYLGNIFRWAISTTISIK